MISYEARLHRDIRHALREGSMHFERESAVHKTLERIARKLDELGIPYAMAGGMAMFFHGYRRFTEVVDIIVTREGLQRIHESLEGLGYVRPFAGSKNLRDADSGVRIDFIVAGGFPGDGKPKPVVFPDPEESQLMIEGMRFLPLDKLIELKLASGTSVSRRRDHADVQEMIKVLDLPQAFVDRLEPSVAPMYVQLWHDTERGDREL